MPDPDQLNEDADLRELAAQLAEEARTLRERAAKIDEDPPPDDADDRLDAAITKLRRPAR